MGGATRSWGGHSDPGGPRVPPLPAFAKEDIQIFSPVLSRGEHARFAVVTIPKRPRGSEALTTCFSCTTFQLPRGLCPRPRPHFLSLGLHLRDLVEVEPCSIHPFAPGPSPSVTSASSAAP